MELDCKSWTVRNMIGSLRDSVASEKLEYLYLPQAKAANTEIKRFLWEVECENGYEVPVPKEYFDVHNYSWRKSTGEDPSPWSCYKSDEFDRFVTDAGRFFLFTVVRNPYVRLLSGYLDKIIKIRKIQNVEEQVRQASRFALPSVPGSFEEFVDMISAQSDHETNVHWTSQFYKSMHDFVSYKYIGHFEMLDRVFSELSAVFGSAEKVRDNNASHGTSAWKVMEQHYSKGALAKVFNRYERDFEIFGYDTDLFSHGPGPVRAPLPSGLQSAFTPDLLQMVKEMKQRDWKAVRQKADELEINARHGSMTLIWGEGVPRGTNRPLDRA